MKRDPGLVWAVLASRTRRDEEAPSDSRPLSAAELLEAQALDRMPSSARVDPWQQDQAGFTSGGGGK